MQEMDQNSSVNGGNIFSFFLSFAQTCGLYLYSDNEEGQELSLLWDSFVSTYEQPDLEVLTKFLS